MLNKIQKFVEDEGNLVLGKDRFLVEVLIQTLCKLFFSIKPAHNISLTLNQHRVFESNHQKILNDFYKSGYYTATFDIFEENRMLYFGSFNWYVNYQHI